MSASARQPLWNIYESVILLDGYIEVMKKEQPRLRIIKRISHDLRQMAVNRGITIDDVYRNENGISYQLQSMESAYQGHKVYVNATNLFVETVSIYNNDRDKYNELLETAKKMINTSNDNYKQYNFLPDDEQSSNGDSPELKFYNYLKDETHLAERTCYSYVSSIKSSERYAANHGYQNTVLFSSNTDKVIATATELYSDVEFVNHNDEQHNRFSAAINKLLQFIGADIPQKVGGVSESRKHGKKEIVKSTEANSEIIKVMNNHYQYGFKVDSIRELMRFRQFAEEMNVTLPDSDDELADVIKESGSLIDGKVFCKNKDLPNELNKIVGCIFSEGIGAIYYSRLYEIHNEWMSSNLITSPDMLKEYLRSHIPNCYFAKTFFVLGDKETERNAVTSEIIRVWGEEQTRTVTSLSNALPYIPIENIWRVISGNDYFVLVEEETYLHTGKLIIKDHEIRDIHDYVDSAITNSGFASLIDIPLGDIEEENYEISHLPLLNALYKRILSADYRLNGCIITKDDTALDAVLLLKHHLANKEQCTFDELNEELLQLTGRVNRQYSFQALYDEMIRVDKNLFVSNSKIKFRVQEIDEVISEFITDGFVSIKEITTFAMFPVCGSTWNHFILESFCYKYSQKYSLHTIHFNDKNVGIIAEKDYDKKYDDMLAIALARSDIDLESASVGQYLFDTGYLSKTKYAPLDRIIEFAKQIRRER